MESIKRNVVVSSWKRPCEFMDNPTLFMNGAHSSDVKQGELGDCFFLGSLSVVAQRNDLFSHLFFSSHPEHGFFQIKFFLDGEWVVVTIDDQLPLRKGYVTPLIFSHCSESNEYWVPIMEKAYAKLHGSYDAIDSGTFHEAITDLTGEGGQIYKKKEKEVQTMIKNGSFAKMVLKFAEEKFLMGCVFAQNKFGLMTGHVYGLLKVVEINYKGKQLVMLKIRNPWGNKEWNGPWSDKSSEWTEESQKLLNHKPGDDGAFWMSYSDFVEQLEDLCICRLLTDKFGLVWQKYLFKGKWDNKTAGGCCNTTDWTKNNQYWIESLENDTNFFVHLSQTNMRSQFHSSNRNYEISIGFYLWKATEKKNKHTERQRDEFFVPVFIGGRDYSQSFTLPKGLFLILPCTFKPNEFTNFYLTIYSDKKINCGEMGGESGQQGSTLISQPPNTSINSLFTYPLSTDTNNNQYPNQYPLNNTTVSAITNNNNDINNNNNDINSVNTVNLNNTNNTFYKNKNNTFVNTNNIDNYNLNIKSNSHGFIGYSGGRIVNSPFKRNSFSTSGNINTITPVKTNTITNTTNNFSSSVVKNEPLKKPINTSENITNNNTPLKRISTSTTTSNTNDTKNQPPPLNTTPILNNGNNTNTNIKTNTSTIDNPPLHKNNTSNFPSSNSHVLPSKKQNNSVDNSHSLPHSKNSNNTIHPKNTTLSNFANSLEQLTFEENTSYGSKPSNGNNNTNSPTFNNSISHGIIPIRNKANEVKNCLQKMICTREATGSDFEEQTWYECFTCGISENSGVCGSCRLKCHEGHKMGPPKISNFYCDCSDHKGCCKIFGIKFPLSNNIGNVSPNFIPYENNQFSPSVFPHSSPYPMYPYPHQPNPHLFSSEPIQYNHHVGYPFNNQSYIRTSNSTDCSFPSNSQFNGRFKF